MSYSATYITLHQGFISLYISRFNGLVVFIEIDNPSPSRRHGPERYGVLDIGSGSKYNLKFVAYDFFSLEKKNLYDN